ncbi:FAD-dependent oxidoreductase [Paenibacillus ferrarius]|uniref:FAD-dependent oxidoreductase n=1 Tax=Paenibacillus ferrarius TaxID=1469647 RepID=UPI0026B40597
MNASYIPQFPESYWSVSADERDLYPKLEGNIEADVAVVGGGIAGITTAYLLAKEGFKVVLIEAGRLLNGTTAHTTAKITAQHDLIYDELIKQDGREKASLYYQANNEALQFIKDTIAKHDITCGYSMQDAYVYTDADSYINNLENEMKAYDLLGIAGEYVTSIPLQIPSKAAVVMRNQAQFHPLHYLNVLVDELIKAQGQIYEHTTAVDVEEGDSPRVLTSDGFQITCKQVVSCTHFPFYDGHGFYFARMHADRSYVLAVQTEEAYPGGMYISAEEPKRSIRYVDTEDASGLLLVGGQSHKTGQGICTINHYEALQQYALKNFRLDKIAYRWSAQDLITGDKIPFIGHIKASSRNVYIATGFHKWGMTNGTAAALLIRDQILNKQNPYADLYTPSRSVSWTTIKHIASDNFDVAKHLIAGKLEMAKMRPEDLSLDEGSVVTVQGKRAGAYKDEQGKLYLVDTTCTHMGCEVEWNNGERTWDCPCHGSRFSVQGEVIEGPAEKPLKRIE